MLEGGDYLFAIGPDTDCRKDPHKTDKDKCAPYKVRINGSREEAGGCGCVEACKKRARSSMHVYQISDLRALFVCLWLMCSAGAVVQVQRHV